MQKRPLIILTGPTAAGKTALSIGLAEALNGEIISADSMQVYRHMDIGTAKIKPGQMKGIRHYLIDELDPCEEFSAAVFKERCQRYMEEIYSRGKVPILAGGTGFYIQSVLYDIDFSKEKTSDSLRKELETLAKTKGVLALHQMLAEVDADSANSIHPNNIKRVIRALEFYRQNGYPISRHNEMERQKSSPYQAAYFVLTDERARLYEKIDCRVDLMLEEGLLEEVRKLKDMGCHRGMISMQGLGYKELLDHLEGEISLEEALYRIKRDTRHFAKRQLTWFGREKDVIWLDKQHFDHDENKILNYMISILEEKGIYHAQS